MIPIVSVPHVQAAPPVAVAAYSGPQTQQNSSLIPNTVPATFTNQAVQNNTRNSPTLRGGATGGAALLPPANAPVVTTPQTGQLLPSGGFSSQFLAQVIGQSGGANDNFIQFLLQGSLPSSPTPSPELLRNFSETKYLPSNASKPQPENNGTSKLLNPLRSAPQAAAKALQAAQAQTQRSIVVPQFASQPAQNAQASVAASNTLQTANPQLSQANRSSPFRFLTSDKSRPPSLVNQQGVDAYLASFSRNIANLRTPPPSISVAI